MDGLSTKNAPVLEIQGAQDQFRSHNVNLEAVITSLESVLAPLIKECGDEQEPGYLPCPSTSPFMRTFYEDLNYLHSLTVRLENLRERISCDE